MKVLVALDFGDSSLEALRQARELAHDVGGVLAACHVLPAEGDFAAFFGRSEPDESAARTREEEEARRALVAHAREKAGLELTEVFVERGAPYAELVRRAEVWGADFIVVGSHGRTGLARAVLGSVAERVVRHAHCTVLIARPVRQAGVVLVATDLSDASVPAIEAGAAAAKRSNARLVVASVIDVGALVPSSAAGMFGALPAIPNQDLLQQLRDSLRSTLEQMMSRVGASGEARVLEGSPAAEIVVLSDELAAELVVVGTHGRTGLARLALGSVAEKVIRSVSSSVLAVRAR